MKHLLPIILFLTLCNILHAKDLKIKILHEGNKRSLIIHLPKNYNSNINHPLVIALHGGKGTAKRFNRSTQNRFNELSDKEDFIIVYPQGMYKSWNDNNKRSNYSKARKENINDVGFIEQMTYYLSSKYSIDTSNIFACGISNGGLMSATLAVKLPNQIKAIGMVASNFSQFYLEEIKLNQIKPFPIIVIHGTKDPIFPFEEGEISFFEQKRGVVIGVEKTISFMCDLNKNELNGIKSNIEDIDKSDKCNSYRVVYTNNLNLPVEKIIIINGGHTWPGGVQYLPKKWVGLVTKDFNACDELWRFFKSTIH